MKRYKNICILLAILIIACVATILVLNIEEKKEEIKNSDEVILQISPDTVTALSWETEAESFSFHKDEKWIYDEDEDFPVNEDTITSLLSIFEEFGASFIIENVENYQQYGLDDPVCTISITTTEQTEDESKENIYEINLGDFSTMDSKRYLSTGDGNVYLVSTDPLDTYDVTIQNLIDNDKTPSFETVSSITFTGSENYSITYAEDSPSTYCADDVFFADINQETLPLDTNLVNSFLNDITALGLTNYVNYKVTEDELKEYGMDDPELTVSVDYGYTNENNEEISDTFVLHVSRNQEAVQKAKEKQETDETQGTSDIATIEETSYTYDDDTTEETSYTYDTVTTEDVPAYVRIGDSAIIYEITSEEYLSLTAASYDDLRHKEILSAAFDDIYQIDVNLEGNTYSLYSETSTFDEESVTWTYLEEETDISNLRTALKSLRANSFTNETPTEKEEISLTVYLDNENFPMINIELYRYNGSECLAVLDGEPTSLVSRSLVVDLIEEVNSIILK